MDRPHRINLWLHDEHYDVIKNFKAFFGSHEYFTTCEKPFQERYHHRCANACPICLRTHCTSGQTVRCDDCGRLCRSPDCFAADKALTGNLLFSLCDGVYQCRKCCKVIRRKDCPRESHRCGTVRCASCDLFVVASDHQCHLKSKKPNQPSDKLIFFDFETDQSSGEHKVNFTVAQYADGTEKVFPGYTALDDFCRWLFTAEHKGFTAVAHNMKGFDGQFIMAWMLQQGTAPEVIPNGSMLMSIHHKPASIRIIDSLNLLPMPLAKLPACFGLTELKKGYFPYLFNTRENQSYVGPLPEAHFYSPDTMAPSALNAFLSWHLEHQADVFHFKDEMASYCKSDVDTLRRCCLEFRTQFIEVADVDPFQNNHIRPDTIAMVPIHGYVNSTNYSPDCIRWLDFLAFTEGIYIQHALNKTGEHKVAGVSVDGFCKESNTIYQYQGSFYHGCERCYDGDTVHPLNRVTMATLRQKTSETTAMLCARGFVVIEVWEHQFLQQKKEDPQTPNLPEEPSPTR